MLSAIVMCLKQILLPSVCMLCDAYTDSAIDLCDSCKENLPQLKQVCLQCGLPLAINRIELQIKCGRCLRYAPAYDQTVALWHYQAPISQFITQLKFNQQLKYARLLGQLMAVELQYRQQQGYCLPECIIPVPLHPSRLRQRGFNQALEIAKPIAQQLKLPVDVKSCQRNQATVPQTTLPAKQRRKNLRHAFAAVNTSGYRHVSIVDDVVTTGCTVNELSKQLRLQGVERIDIWCCARTIR